MDSGLRESRLLTSAGRTEPVHATLGFQKRPNAPMRDVRVRGMHAWKSTLPRLFTFQIHFLSPSAYTDLTLTDCRGVGCQSSLKASSSSYSFLQLSGPPLSKRRKSQTVDDAYTEGLCLSMGMVLLI